MRIFYKEAPQESGESNFNTTHQISSLESRRQEIGQGALNLIDSDKEGFIERLQNDPNAVLRIINNQSDRLGCTLEEKRQIFDGLSVSNLQNIVHFMNEGEGTRPNERGNPGIAVFPKIGSKNTIEELISAHFRTPGIVEIYPDRLQSTPEMYNTISHEVNHIIMSALVLYRLQKKGMSGKNIVNLMKTDHFNTTTETLAWLDGGQAPMNLGYFNQDEINRFTGFEANRSHSNQAEYNLEDNYSMAKLRAFRIHTLQMKIYNLPDTNHQNYQKWCREIRDFILEYVDNPEGLDLLDQYLDQNMNQPVRARDIFLQEEN